MEEHRKGGVASPSCKSYNKKTEDRTKGQYKLT